MNDSELDRLLDAWQAPAPPARLRREIRERFPRAERRGLVRQVRWLAAVAAATAALAVGMEQSGGALADSSVVRVRSGFYDHLMEAVEAHRMAAMVWWIRQSEPRTFVDGRPAPPIEFRHSAVFDVQIPGDGIYSIAISGRALQGWEQAGRIHGSTIEFQAGVHHVVIQCSRSLTSSEMPVLVQRRGPGR